MKRKDFLRKMRKRRRGDEIEKREPGKHRKVDWRTLRVDLPGPDEDSEAESLPVGELHKLSGGIRLEASAPCWVRGYRFWTDDDGIARAEFQYRPVEAESEPPPGSTALASGDTWEPEG